MIKYNEIQVYGHSRVYCKRNNNIQHFSAMHFHGLLHTFKVLFMYSITYIETNTECPVSKNCHLYDWIGWSECKGSCNTQTQTRSRVLCCPTNLPHRSKATCVKHCNVTGDINEERPCMACTHGINVYPGRCQCDIWYRGPCCEGMTYCFTCSKQENIISLSQIR